MKRDEFRCRYCHSKEKTLHVHHRHYRKGAMPWDYENYLLVTLCEECHQEAESLKSFICERLGSSKHDDYTLVRICAALHTEPEQITFLGWAATGLASAIAEAVDFHELYEKDPEEASVALGGIRSSITECIKDLHRAMFHIEEKYPL